MRDSVLQEHPVKILCRIDGYYENGVHGFVNFSELTKTGAKAILYLVKSNGKDC